MNRENYIYNIFSPYSSYMSKSNLERMIQLAGDIFDARNDPDQLDVDEQVIARLKSLHPYTVSEYDDGNGPVAWVLLIPTTARIMNLFLEGDISERELFDMTLPGEKYDSLYLCSAMVLEEYRRQGITKKLILNAITEIMKVHAIRALYVWTFSKEGELAAEALSKLLGLPLFKRKDHK